MKKNEYFWNIFPKYEKLLYHLAAKTCSNLQNFEDQKSLAIQLYGELMIYKYQPGRGSQKSFIGKSIYNSLISQKQSKEILWIEDEPEIESHHELTDQSAIFYEQLNQLSEEALIVIHLILYSSSDEWFEVERFKKDTIKKNLVEYLHYEYEWGYNKIWRIFKEIKSIWED